MIYRLKATGQRQKSLQAGASARMRHLRTSWLQHFVALPPSGCHDDYMIGVPSTPAWTGGYGYVLVFLELRLCSEPELF